MIPLSVDVLDRLTAGAEAADRGPDWPEASWVAEKRDLFVNGEGQTFAVVRGPVKFTLGSSASEPGAVRGDRGGAPKADLADVRDRDEGGDGRAVPAVPPEIRKGTELECLGH
jgi:hypothetical protein